MIGRGGRKKMEEKEENIVMDGFWKEMNYMIKGEN